VRAGGPILATALTLGAWTAIARTSGSGWVQALGAVVAGFLVVGLVAPRRPVRRARCRVVEAPADATAGTAFAFTVAVDRPLRLRPAGPPGGPVLTGDQAEVALTATARHRGVIDALVVDVASAAPFGLLWWSKRVALPLSRPVHVAPRTGPPDWSLVVEGQGRGEDARRIEARVGESRGLREYRSGDQRRAVHWPATAHHGRLMVREMELPGDRPLTVRVALPADPEAAERVAERALGTVAALVAAGRRVLLVTDEPGGLVAAPVGDAGSAGRRLARAVAPGGPR
jgi:uncharacterized protein (DUF58 family)